MQLRLRLRISQTEPADLFLDSVGREESKAADDPNCEENHIVHAAPPQVKEPILINPKIIFLVFYYFIP